MLEHGHRGTLRDQSHELLAAAGNDEVDEAVEGEHGHDGGAVGGVHDLHRIGGESGLLHGFGEHLGDGGVGLQRFAAPAQQHGIARFQAEPRGIGGDVGPGLVDEPHHAQRHADPRDLHPVGAPPCLGGLSHRIGEGGDLAKPRRHLLDPALGERETVHEGARQLPPIARGPDRNDWRRARGRSSPRAPRHLLERVVLRSCGSERERAGRLLGRPRLARHMGQHVHISFLPGRRAPPGCPGE